MRFVVVVIIIFALSQNTLFAQEKTDSRVITVRPSYILSVKHTRADSLYHTKPQIRYAYKQLKNTHIGNPAARYALENLKKERLK